jgi:N4-gp56 family major capsid protein
VAQTLSTDLIQPEVLADILSAEFPNKIRFAPLATVDTTLQGRPGDTITRPEWSRLTDATVLAETDVLVPEKLTQSSDTVTIKEAGKAVEITDKALLTSIGNPLGEARSQIVGSIASKIDADLYATMAATTLTVVNGTSGTPKDFKGANAVAAVAAAFAKFPEMDEPSDMFAGLVLSNQDYMDLVTSDLLLTADKAGANATLFRGSVGSFMGVPIIVSNRASAGALLIRRGAVVLSYKRNVLVETDRDILARSNVISANVHYGTFLQRRLGVVKITTTRAA